MEGGQIKPSAPNRGAGLAGSGGEDRAQSTDPPPPNQQQGGCLSPGLEAGDGVGGLLAPGPQQPGASLPLLRAATCAISQGPPLRASGFGPASQDLFPGAAASTINMHACQELPAGRARSKGFSPLQRNLTPASVFKDKNLCMKRPSDSEGIV